MTPRIRQLSPNIVNKIAAGEVVERPASVVKELIENSVDAGARSIAIELLEGGAEQIRIVDDGCGIAAEDLPLAVASHATSKIASAEDLFRVDTLGFRGEALASIAAVSDFRLQSRPPGQPVGARIEVRGGVPGPVVDCGCPVGTQVEVRNLFESLPVRRKFLKSKQTELGHVAEAVVRVALARPGLAVVLRHNERTLYELPPNLDRREAIRLFFGAEVADALIPVESFDDGVRLHGFAAHPSVHRPNNRLQYLFVNGRYIRDRSLGHAVIESYRGLILSGRCPVCFLFLEIPPDRVDVNVHPTKIEVRFQEPRRVYSQILSTLRERFLESDLAASLRPAPSFAPQAVAATPSHCDSLGRGFALRPAAPLQTQARLWSRPPDPFEAPPFTTETPDPVRLRPDGGTAALPVHPPDGADETSIPPLSTPRALKEEAPSRAASSPSPESPPPAANCESLRALQLHNAYLVVETPEGMLVVDQHALHERVLYENLKRRLAGQAVEVQDLLVPEPVDLTPTQVGLLMEHRSVLAQAGLRIDEFGERTVLLQGFPAMLRKVRPAELVRDVVARLEETGRAPSREQILDDMLHMVACKAAVKAGDPLTPGEIQSLVQAGASAEEGHHCPHGRPAVLRLTLGELERQFQRK
jgi:DNA mismatch repair protein MutL